MPGDMPAGWVYLMTYWCKWASVKIDFTTGIPGARWRYDSVLCPEHNTALEALLKPVLPAAQP